MNNNPLISIVIPVYNEEEFLPEAIESIQNQTYKNFEAVFINDGSVDNSVSIIENYSANDPRIKVFSKSHSGLIPSINYGFKVSNGSIVCRMDADDIMPKNRLQLQIKELLNRGKNSLITGKVKYFPKGKTSQGYRKYQSWLNSLSSPEDFLTDCFIECPVAAPSWMMFKEDVKALDYFDNDIYPEDYNFILKALFHGVKIYSINEIVLHWRDYDSRTSKTSADYSRDNFWNVRALHLKKFIEHFTKYDSVVIFGVGASGKNLCKSIQKQDIYPIAFVDTHPERIGTIIQNTEVLSINDTSKYKNSFILVAILDSKVKSQIQKFLAKLDKEILKDYIFCC